MRIVQATLDEWIGGRDRGRTFDAANLDVSTIDTLVGNLDGERHTLLLLRDVKGDEMGIGGGSKGRYIVYVASGDETFREAETASPPAGPLSIVAGGQAGDYEPTLCLTRDEAAAAVREWVESGQLSTALRWRTP